MVTEPKRPWWQATRTSKGGFLVGGLWAVLSLGQWLLIQDGRALSIVVAVAWSLVAAAYLASAVLLRRREKAAPRAFTDA